MNEGASPEDALREALAENLAAARQAAREGFGYTQTEVAQRMGLNKATVSAWETGRGMPNALMMLRLARLYGTTIESLVGEAPLSPQAVSVARMFDTLAVRQRATLLAICKAYMTGETAAPPPERPPQDDAAAEDAIAQRLIDRARAKKQQPAIRKKAER